MATKYSYPAQGYNHRNSEVPVKIEELDHLVPKKNLLTDHNNSWFKTRWFLFIFTVIFTMPFIIVDTIFAYSNFSCQEYYIPGINISLDIWLKIIAYTSIFSLLIELFVIYFDKSRENVSYNILNFTHLIVQIFIIGWTIFGAYIYWHNYGNSDICSASFNKYMWVRLIAGLCGCALKLFTIYMFR
jgi:hypothetical protein